VHPRGVRRLGAGFETYCLGAEQLARGNAATALCYNMHATTMLMMGEIADGIQRMSAELSVPPLKVLQ
jgi:hypothetical protein